MARVEGKFMPTLKAEYRLLTISKYIFSGDSMKTWSLLLILLFLAGCNTLEGIGKDLRRSGEAIENAAK